MRQRHRTEDESPDQPETNGEGSSERLSEARDTGRELLSAAERALSGDSRQFMGAIRQRDGQ